MTPGRHCTRSRPSGCKFLAAFWSCSLLKAALETCKSSSYLNHGLMGMGVYSRSWVLIPDAISNPYIYLTKKNYWVWKSVVKDKKEMEDVPLKTNNDDDDDEQSSQLQENLFEMTKFATAYTYIGICLYQSLFFFWGGGLEPRTAGWKAQTNPLCYGGTPSPIIVT